MSRFWRIPVLIALLILPAGSPAVLAEEIGSKYDADLQKVVEIRAKIGNNCVLRECLGPSALDRFERDILRQHGVRWLIIFEGINDIGQTSSQAEAMLLERDPINAFGEMLEKAHTASILVYGATLPPFGKSFYYTDYREKARQTVNEWIRSGGRFDGVIDFDKAL